MDLIFNRYSDPFLFINSLIKGKGLSKGLRQIIRLKDEELTWQMYLSTLSNPLAKVNSFNEFKKKLLGGRAGLSDRKTKEVQAEKVKKISNESANILKNFKPQ